MGNFSDVAIIDVLVKPGDAIDKDASLITLETEKATMDVPSDVAGVVEKLHVAKGGKVSPGDVVATVRVEGDAAGVAAGGSAPAGASAGGSNGGPAASTAGTAAGSAGAGSAGGGAGAGASGASASNAAGPAGPSGAGTGGSGAAGAAGASAKTAPSAASAAPSSTPTSTTAATTTAPATGNGAAHSAGNGAAPPVTAIPGGRTDLAPINEAGFSRAHAGPSVRRFARELGVDLSLVTGTGFKARITHDDVKAYVKKALTSSGAAAGGAAAKGGGAGLPQIPPVDFAKFGPVETKPLSRIQKISGPRLHASWVNIPHVTQFDEADITDLEDVRTKLKQKALVEGIKLTPLAFIVRACVKALQEFPVFNSSLDATGANLVMKKYVNIGFAADTPNGLVVPVIANADRLDIYRIARALGDLSEKARAGKLSAAEMQGGCFTISSLGGIGGTAFTPIINAPEVAILGVSRSSHKPVYKDGTFIPRLTLPLSLSYDHRVIDGAMAVRFTTYLAGVLADPRQLTEAVL
jgi:pyruvate dehydrogenase E2 component (dihydrolipoamide acetyltransferase)